MLRAMLTFRYSNVRTLISLISHRTFSRPNSIIYDFFLQFEILSQTRWQATYLVVPTYRSIVLYLAPMSY